MELLFLTMQMQCLFCTNWPIVKPTIQPNDQAVRQSSQVEHVQRMRHLIAGWQHQNAQTYINYII